MAAALYDLTTLAAVKAWLGIPDTTTSSDVLLQSLLTSASRFLLNYLSRGNIISASYTDRFDGSGWGQRSVLLPRWPVTSISSLLVDGTVIPAAVAPSAAAPNPSGYLLEPWDGIPAGRPQAIDLFGYGIGRGMQNIVVAYAAGYLVSSEAATIPATPLQVTPVQPYGAWAADGGVVLASTGAALVKVTGTPATGQYAVSATGVYTFAAADVGLAVLISYSYVPLDLAQACFQMVGESQTYRSRIGVASKSLGGQETITYTQKSLTTDIVNMLQNYKAVVPFA